ncbi:hypothetical protein K2173_008758 [Erythroxylum novogranatense]|uniref:Bifunctional inhibitor/plant lipid transfer protein/seed storage helical domain-containing protein n=1 Tax=Erythroxylum novogranatense TaxID=1862640 RepID=A0AAV8S5I6_9ROSI|nr:hypothetical protein K2173_008758 [Erythroxylum novogranatense]
MELFVPSLRMVSGLVIALLVLVLPVYGQVSTICSPSLLSSFTPCMNYLTSSSSNGTSPTSECCGVLKNMTNNGMDCLCLIVTASVPFRVPINRTLAISLPRFCNMPGVPVQCKASSAPIPAPGPAALGPVPSSGAPLSPTPEASAVPQPTPSTTPTLTPPSPTTNAGAPTSSSPSGIRPVLTPPSTSSTMPSSKLSPYLILLTLGSLLVKYY